MFETNYSSCTGRSSENICSSSGCTQEKRKTGWNSVYHQNWWFSEWVSTPLSGNVLSCRCFFVPRPMYDQTQDSGAVFSSLYWQLYYIKEVIKVDPCY
jgi:hypothetical protein